MASDLDSTFDSWMSDDQPEDEDVEADEEERQHFYFGESRAHITERHDHLKRDLKHVPDWDDDYEPNIQLFEQLVHAASADQPTILVGPKGSGKSSAVLALAALVRQPVIRINMTGQTRVRDFVGFKTLDYEEDEESGEVYQVINWVDGVAPMVLRRDYWLLIDEIDATPPSVLFSLQAMLEEARTLVMLENGGEVVEPVSPVPGLPDEIGKRRMRIFATANTLGFGDETGLYAGTNVMNQATVDRMNVIFCDYPPPEVERAIVEARTKLAGKVVEKMVAFAGLTRDAVDADSCGVKISTRQLVSWGKMIGVMCEGGAKTFRFPTSESGTAYHTLKLAYGMTVGNKLPAEDKAFYAGVFHREYKLNV